MSGDYVDTARQLEAAGQLAQEPTQEPFFAQEDDMIRQTIVEKCYKWENREIDGVTKAVPVEEVHPRIVMMLPLLSRLERSSNFSEDQARINWFNIKQIIRKVRGYYNGFAAKEIREEGLSILDTFKKLCLTITFGDAEKGKRQSHIEGVAGAKRQITFQDGNIRGKSLMERMRGR